MPIPTLITDLSQTAASNFPQGTDSPSSLDDVQRAHASFIAQIRDGTVAVAGTGLTGTAAALSIGGNAATATNIAGGAGGQVLYQSAAGVTTKLANGTAGQLVQSGGGTAAPAWANLGQIQPVTSSVAASALTCTLNPTSLDFRSATIGSGTVVTRAIGSAISVVVPSTATLGTVSAVQSRIVLLAIDNAGTVELAVVNIAGGNDLTETGVISTTAISATATASNVIYSTTARTGVSYRVVGYVESTQATAGTWATAPSTIQGVGGQALTAMSSLGYGQTWQSVTRNSGTTYYNTTGKPIDYAVQINGTVGNASHSVTIDGISVVIAQNIFISAGNPSCGSIRIGVGKAYTPVDTGVTTRSTWEMR